MGGVATELLSGLAALGHRIDAFFPSSGQQVPARLSGFRNVTFNWGASTWEWDRWYSRSRISAMASGMAARGVASLMLRRQLTSRHRDDPFDLVYQFSSVESPGAPWRLCREIPLVLHPETHAAGELRALIAERRLGLRCHPPQRLAAVAGIMLVRSLLQRASIGRAGLLVCISGVFRDHLVADYGFPRARTVVVPNPVSLHRFSPSPKPVGDPPTVLVLGRIAARKGVEDVVAAARALHDRGTGVRVRIIGGPSLWSDYTPLLGDLPEGSEYVGAVDASEVAAELAACDVLLQASHYEPFAITVAEALAAGLPVVGTSEVGALEGVDRSVTAEVAPGDVAGIVTAITEMLERLRRDPARMSALARSEAERLFAPGVVSGKISEALLALVGGDAPARREPQDSAAAGPRGS